MQGMYFALQCTPPPRYNPSGSRLRVPVQVIGHSTPNESRKCPGQRRDYNIPVLLVIKHFLPLPDNIHQPSVCIGNELFRQSLLTLLEGLGFEQIRLTQITLGRFSKKLAKPRISGLGQ